MPQMTAPLSRRSALKLLSANVALIAAGCGRPPDNVLPYVHMPERLAGSVPLRFATILPLGAYGRGVIATSVEGRPIKISGNPDHAASRGATDVFAEAHVLSLYDPDRSQACRGGINVASWDQVMGALNTRLDRSAREGWTRRRASHRADHVADARAPDRRPTKSPAGLALVCA